MLVHETRAACDTCIDKEWMIDVSHNSIVLQRVICVPSKLQQVLHMPAQALLHQLGLHEVSIQCCRLCVLAGCPKSKPMHGGLPCVGNKPDTYTNSLWR